MAKYNIKPKVDAVITINMSEAEFTTIKNALYMSKQLDVAEGLPDAEALIMLRQSNCEMIAFRAAKLLSDFGGLN